MTKSRDLGNLAQTVAVNLPTSLGTAGQSLVVNSGADGLEFGAASGGSGVTVYTGLSGTDGTPSGATYLLNASNPSAGDLAYVTANTSLYQYNGSGWYRIAVINTTPTISSVVDASSNTTPFTLEGGTNTVITVTASDADEGTDLTYSYSVTSGSLNGTTVTQGTGVNENVFTITPHASNATTFSLTFTVSDSINAATSVAAFTLEFQITDSHYTTLLMATDGSAGDNSTITYDTGSSTGNSLTVNGDAHAGTFSPYRHGGYSTYMVNTDDLTVASDADFNFGSGDFTIEYWIWPNGTPNNPVGLPDMRPANTNGTYVQININTSNQVGLYVDSAQRISQSSSTALTSYAWNHVCLARSGSTTTLYIGGASVGSWSDSTTYSQGRCLIAGHSIETNRGWASGCYISDFRIVKGTAITPASGGPTERLTAVTNTSLLTCHLPYIADTPPSGGTAKTITVNGDPETKPFGPYDYQQYSASTNGGSVYFDGSGDYLTYSAGNEIGFSTGDFTVEFWAYNKFSTGSLQKIIETRTASTWIIQIDSTNNFEWYNGSTTVFNYDISYTKNTWAHFVVTRDGTTLRLFVNGRLVSTATDSVSYSVSSGTVYIGRRYNDSLDYFSGYLTDLRIVKGSVVTEYQTSSTTTGTQIFTPPTAPLTAITDTSILLKGTDARVLDKSQNANLKLVGNAAAVTNAPNNSNISSTNAVSFDGDGDRIYLDENNSLYNLSYGEGDFSIEGWFYFNSYSNNPKLYIDIESSSVYWQLYYVSGTGLTFRANNTGINVNAGSALSLNTWYHIALVREGSTYKVYVDGTSVISTTTTHQIGSNSYKDIGGTATSAAASLDGYIQDFRLTKGLARHVNTSGTYTYPVPSAPLKG